jgi:hypothetical protein
VKILNYEAGIIYWLRKYYFCQINIYIFRSLIFIVIKINMSMILSKLILKWITISMKNWSLCYDLQYQPLLSQRKYLYLKKLFFIHLLRNKRIYWISKTVLWIHKRLHFILQQIVAIIPITEKLYLKNDFDFITKKSWKCEGVEYFRRTLKEKTGSKNIADGIWIFEINQFSCSLDIIWNEKKFSTLLTIKRFILNVKEEHLMWFFWANLSIQKKGTSSFTLIDQLLILRKLEGIL